MRPRRRRPPRGPRPPQPGGAPEAGAFVQQPQGRRRRRRPRGTNRPITNDAPQPYADSRGSAGMNSQAARMQNGQQRRRRQPRGRPSGDRRRGLEILRDIQQIGVALDPIERLVLELWERLRDERAFAGEAELIEAIAADVEATRRAVRP